MFQAFIIVQLRLLFFIKWPLIPFNNYNRSTTQIHGRRWFCFFLMWHLVCISVSIWFILYLAVILMEFLHCCCRSFIKADSFMNSLYNIQCWSKSYKTCSKCYLYYMVQYPRNHQYSPSNTPAIKSNECSGWPCSNIN